MSRMIMMMIAPTIILLTKKECAGLMFERLCECDILSCHVCTSVSDAATGPVQSVSFSLPFFILLFFHPSGCPFLSCFLHNVLPDSDVCSIHAV